MQNNLGESFPGSLETFNLHVQAPWSCVLIDLYDLDFVQKEVGNRGQVHLINIFGHLS